MRGLFYPLLVLSAASSFALAQDSSTATDSAPVVQEILVSGDRPGPALWTATRDGKTLWILGMYAPLPAAMRWRSREVEARIAESDVVVRWVQLETDVEMGFFARLGAIPAVMSLGDNPKGVKLKDRVAPQAYAKWQELKQKFISRGVDSVEGMRPAFAASELRTQAMNRSGLSSPKPESIVWPEVERMAKKHKVKIVEPEARISIEIEKPREVIGRFRNSELGDADCFAKSVERLEYDLVRMKARANAWSIGDLDVLRGVPPPDPALDCEQLLRTAILNGTLLEQLGTPESASKAARARLEFNRGLQAVNQVWIDTVEFALRDHSSVFALVPIGDLFDPNGPLRLLREHGFVESSP